MDTLIKAMHAHLAEGAGLARNRVHLALENLPRDPKTFASLFVQEDRAVSWPTETHTDWGVRSTSLREATFIAGFHNADAGFHAQRFAAWCASEVGRSQESTAFADGGIESIRVIDSGSGYTEPPELRITGDGGLHGNDCIAVPVMSGGGISRVDIVRRGQSYSDPVQVQVPGNAVLTAQGGGFAIMGPIEWNRYAEEHTGRYTPDFTMQIVVQWFSTIELEIKGISGLVNSELIYGDHRTQVRDWNET